MKQWGEGKAFKVFRKYAGNAFALGRRRGEKTSLAGGERREGNILPPLVYGEKPVLFLGNRGGPPLLQYTRGRGIEKSFWAPEWTKYHHRSNSGPMIEG